MCLLLEDYTSSGFIEWQAIIWYPLPIPWPHPLVASSTLSCRRHGDAIRCGDTTIIWYTLWINKGLATGLLWQWCLQNHTWLTTLKMLWPKQVQVLRFSYQTNKYVYIYIVIYREVESYNHTHTCFDFLPAHVRFIEPCREIHTWLHSSSICLCPSDLTARH